MSRVEAQPATGPWAVMLESGLGVPCCEAQADGVPCTELGIPCADCERAHRPPFPEGQRIRLPRRRAGGPDA